MNTARNYFYLASAWGSGLCLIAMTLLILAQIFARMLGVVIPSSEDFAGWILSATIFFGLAYTFNSGGHIRVTIVLSRLSRGKAHFFEKLNITIALIITAYLAYYTGFTVYESYAFEDVTDTYLAVPLWWVQFPMAIGSLCLFIAVLDNFAQMLLGREPAYMRSESQLEREEG